MRSHPQPSTPSSERGIALVLALLGIVLIGALVTGTLFAARLEMASGRNSVYTTQATEAAEAGIAAAFNPWNNAWNDVIAYPLLSNTQGSWVYPLYASGNSSIRYRNTVRRLKGGIYQITSQGDKLDRSGNVLSTRFLVEFGKLIVPSVDINAAVTANADVTVNGHTTKIDGHDQLPSGWTTECPAPAAGSGVYGIRTSQTVTTTGNPDIQGVPAATKETDATVVASLFITPFNALAPYATITLSGAGGTQTYSGVQPSVSGGACNRTDLNNWGEPYRVPTYISQCTTYFPIVYYPGTGTLKLTTGRAQGIILSAGDIDIAGNFEFDGIMLALGSIDTHGTGNKITGAVLSGNANINDDDVVGGTPTILYSSCAVKTVLNYSAAGVPLANRKWAQLTPR